jgi:ATP-binding cassette subfamily B protein
MQQQGLDHQSMLLATQTDISTQGDAQLQWLIVSPSDILIFSDGAPPEMHRKIALASVTAFRAQSVIGSGFLQAQVDGLWVDVLRYSNSLSDRFVKVSKKLEDLRKKGTLVIHPEDEIDQRRCPTCGLALRFVGDVCPQCINKRAVIGRVWDLIRPYRLAALGIFSLLLLSVCAELAPPKLQQYLVDHVLRIDHKNAVAADLINALLIIVLSLAAARVIVAVVGEFKGRLANKVGTALTFDLRARMVQKLHQLSVGYYDRQQVGVLMNRVAYDTEAMHGLVQQITGGFLLQILQLVGVGIMLFTLNSTLALYTLIPMPLVFAGSWSFWRYVYPKYYRYWDSASKQAGALSGMLAGIRVVKAFGQEQREFERFRESSTYLRASRMSVEHSAITFSAIMQVIFSLGGLIVWYVGGRDVLADRMTLGSLMAFLAYLAMFYAPLSTLAQLTTWLTSFMTASQRVFELLDTPVRITDPANPTSLATVKGNIKFENVAFGYDRHHPILHDVSFEIPAGQMIGIVGRSGSGKTTIVNLICRFYDVDEGRVLVDGHDVRDVARHELSQNVGVVLQEPFLFRGTVWENLIYGKPDATPEEAISASRAASSHDFILRMPFGYDTPLGERGAGLSGGEKQRLSIARAILFDPPILILDEATSNLDSESEKGIQDALKVLTKGRTTIAIAHRLSTLRHADRVMVFEHGKLIEQGPHAELLALDGTYARLVKMQTQLTGTPTVERLLVAAESKDTEEVAVDGEVPGNVTETAKGDDQPPAYLPRWLTPEIATVHLGTHDALHVTVVNDRIFGGVIAIRCFPAARPEEYISLRFYDADGQEQEIGIISRLSDWPIEARRLIGDALDRRYYVHTIQRIRSIVLKFGMLVFHVQTTRGDEQFMMRWAQSQAQDYGRSGKILTDVDENRYLVPDVEALPRSEQILFRRYVYW